MGTTSSFGSLSAQTDMLQSREDLMIRQMNSAAGTGDDAKIEKGSKEFEAILVGSWLQQAEQSFATVPGADEDQDAGGQQMMSLGVQQLATAMAANGGLGIGKMIAKAMHENAERANAQGSSQPEPAAALPQPSDRTRNRAERGGLD